MKKLLLTFTVLFSLSYFAVAQQSPMYTQYMFNGVSINPAYAGSHGLLSVIGLYRNQWLNIEGAPTTFTLTGDAQLPSEKVGLAVSMYNDKIGVTNDFGFYSAFAYKLKFPAFTLSMGLSAGFNQFVGDFSSITSETGATDPVFQNNLKAISPNFGAGLYLYSAKYYAGFSIPQLVKENPFAKGAAAVSQFENAKHYFITGGYLFDITKDIKLKPAVMVKVVRSAPIEWDFSAIVWFMDRLGLGLAYRTKDSFDALFELQINRQLSFGYAYDYPVTDVRKVSIGSHEVMLRYDFDFDKSKVITPRYF